MQLFVFGVDSCLGDIGVLTRTETDARAIAVAAVKTSRDLTVRIMELRLQKKYLLSDVEYGAVHSSVEWNSVEPV